MDSIKSQLLDMGFSETKVKRAMASCPDAQTLEQVMEWLIAHEDELNSEPNDQNPNSSTLATGGHAQANSSDLEQTSQGLNESTANNNSKTGETSAEEAARKKITVEEAKRLIAERMVKRAEEERKKEIDLEKKRREMGQKILETRQEMQDQERIRLAQQIRREKQEKEMHKRQVLEQIARDREAMRSKSKPTRAENNEQAPKGEQTSSGGKSSGVPKSSASECRLALRFPDGTSKVQKFSPQEQLSAVRLFVQMEKSFALSSAIEFVAPPNRKLTDSEMNASLEGLGLCPASRLEVKYNTTTGLEVD